MTVAVCRTLSPPSSRAVSVTTPALVPAVYAAVYVPSRLSVTTPIEPSDGVSNVSVPALEVRLLPAASLSWTVSVLVLVPLAVRLLGLAVTVLASVLAGEQVPHTGREEVHAGVSVSKFDGAVVMLLTHQPLRS